MTDIVQRLIAHNSCGCGCSSDTRALIGEAADEIVRLRGELANVQRDRMAQAEVENLRQDVQFWTDEAQKFKESSHHNYAECARLRALITEWSAAHDQNARSNEAWLRYDDACFALHEEANR